jgi:hypothetical protein
MCFKCQCRSNTSAPGVVHCIAFMPKKQLILLVAAVLLFGVYAYYFTDWFAAENIQIVHSLRPITSPKRARGRTVEPNPAVNAVSFSLDRKCKLTEITVIPVADLATNKYAHPIWHLVSESNSVPTKAFVYGAYIRGMHPKVKGAKADPLEPDVPYRLFVAAGKLTGEHDFKTTAKK